MFFYNQLDYKNVPYNKPNGETATVKSGGCGVCSTLMVLNNLYGREMMTVPQMAKFSIEHGARTNYGTDVGILLLALSKKYDITYRTTSLNKELWAHLKAGGMAIINQGDKYNVFSREGHFVVGYKAIGTDTVICLDPYWYAGKFDSEPRKNRIVKIVGKEIYVKLSEIGKCSQDRNPSYYLVTYTGKKNKPNLKKGQNIKLKSSAALYNSYSSQSGVKKIGDFSNFLCNEKAILKNGAVIKAEEIKTKANGNVWVRTKYADGWICVYDYKNDISKV